MNAAGKDDRETWDNHWFTTYKDLGGQSDSSGSKICPKRAAYGIWCLGRISNSGRTFENWTLESVRKELGKNAVYAVLALDLLEMKRGRRGTEGDWSNAELWAKVQETYQKKLGELTAHKQEGAVTIALGLFTEGQTLSRPQ
tara:strand:+ start:1166 stop:1591 length:426 start_codon:yes stop_codon:yes gene_type:complete